MLMAKAAIMMSVLIAMLMMWSALLSAWLRPSVVFIPAPPVCLTASVAGALVIAWGVPSRASDHKWLCGRRIENGGAA